MRELGISAVLGIVVAVMLALAVLSTQSASNLLPEDSILGNYGER